MSLLNDVLRDLQARGAPEADSLAGLKPVTDVRPREDRRTRVMVLLAVVTTATAVLFWQPVTSDTNSAEVEPATASISMPAQQQPHVAEAIGPMPASADVALPDETERRADPTPVSTPAPEAVAPATTIVRRNSDDTDVATNALIERGLRAMQTRNYGAAEQFFREATAADAGDTAAWTYLFQAQSAAAKPAVAERTLQRALSSAREPTIIAKLYARLLIDRGETGAAVQVLQDHRGRAAGDTDYDAFLAALLQKQSRFADAGAIYRQLLDQDQSQGAWWVGLALSSDSLGDSATALAAFQRALLTEALEPPLARYAERRIAELKTNG